jgi:hypothetical protein
MKFTVFPSEWYKDYKNDFFKKLWMIASQNLKKADRIVVIGYSLPVTDFHTTALFTTSLSKGKLKSLVVDNPDSEARQRVRSDMQNGLKNNTCVLSFNKF